MEVGYCTISEEVTQLIQLFAPFPGRPFSIETPWIRLSHES